MRLTGMIFTALLFMLVARASAAQTYSSIYVFGDSYCDTGNLFLGSGGLDPAPPYVNGEFSNGPLWVEQVADQFSLPVAPFLAGGTNFAIGGAQLVGAPLVPSITDQVEVYLYLHNNRADPNALFVLEGGINDILNGSGSPTNLGTSVADNLALLELGLWQAGARHFLIPNLINIGALPIAAGQSSYLTTATEAANSTLAQLLGTQKSIYGTHISSPDVFSLIASVQAAPAQYGLIDAKDPCLYGDYQVCADPAGTLFWDTVHPTTVGHSLIAALIEEQVHP